MPRGKKTTKTFTLTISVDADVIDKLPETYMGRTVIDGTDTDLRFLDGKDVIVGLLAKGKAKKDNSGFTVLTQLKRAA